MYISHNLNYHYFYYFYYYCYYILYTGLEVFLIDVVNSFLYSFNSVVHTHYLEIFIKQSVNNELRKVHSWLCAKKLSLNIGKTNVVIFHPRQKKITNTISLKINYKPIKQKDSIKYLGIIMDSSLNWKEHIKQLSKKISRGIGLISNFVIMFPNVS